MTPATSEPGIRLIVTGFFDDATSTVSYVVRDPASKACAFVDPVLDFDYPSGTISYVSAEKLVKFVGDGGLELEWLIETHVHADHLSAAPWIQEHLGGRIGIGAKVIDVQRTFGKVFHDR